jgi:hypothetical protein
MQTSITREFVAPCTDREALRRKLLQVLTAPPARFDAIERHLAILRSVAAYSPFFIEGSITTYPNRTAVRLFLCTVDDRSVATAERQLFEPSRSATFIAKKASRRFWVAVASRLFELESEGAKQHRLPLGSGHVVIERGP